MQRFAFLYILLGLVWLIAAMIFGNWRPGGLLVLDNSEWEKYAPVFAAASGWPRRDFENGVWRTTIWRRPGAANA